MLMTTEEGGAQAKEYTAKYAADRVRNASSVWMGATLACAECHDAAAGSETSADVLIPGQDTCLKCHAPPSSSGGGARFDCAECHRYHNGDAPLQGPGAAALGVRDRLTVPQFLHGDGGSAASRLAIPNLSPRARR